MNERIKELAEQAGMVKFPPSIETELQKNILFGDGQIEKFAELIVQECVQMFAENGYDESCDMLIEHWDIDPRTFRS
jgi:hypothetical protein